MSRALLVRTVALAGLSVSIGPAAARAAEKMKAEEVVARHLETVSPEAGRFGPRMVSGACRLFAKQVGFGSVAGRFTLSASPPGSRLAIEFGTNEYGSEAFAFDGQDVEIGFSKKQAGRRSALAAFVAANEVIVREGLLGGVLNGSWPLAALAERQARVSSDGLKKLEGRELQRLKYRASKGQGDLSVTLWFEPETFRHVATVYTRSRTQDMVMDPTQSSRQSDVFFRLEERFSDWKAVGGLAVPSVWTLRYEASSNTTVEWKYELTVETLEKK
jgi:hypothetical protein